MADNNELFNPRLQDAQISYYPNFIPKKLATSYFETLLSETRWKNDNIKVFGKTYPQPRMTSLYGKTSYTYGYSGIVMHPNEMTPTLLEIQEKLVLKTKTSFTTVLLNLYRDGKDSNGWHADNEPELGKNPVIASISFGATRFFQLKHNLNKSQKIKIELTHGSLLLMEGETQHFWKHQIAKTSKEVGPRINLTFREVFKVH